MINKFTQIFQPTNTIIVPTKIVKEYQNKIPKELMDIWMKFGFGKFGKGIIELVNPKDYEGILWQWIGEKHKHIVPIAISSLGHLFYYVKWRENESKDYNDEIRFIDPTSNQFIVVCWSGKEFFTEFYENEYDLEDTLFNDFFNYGLEKKGELKIGEIYPFKEFKEYEIYEYENIGDICSAIEYHKKLLMNFEGEELELLS